MPAETKHLSIDEFADVNERRSMEGFGKKIDDWSAAEWLCATMGELGELANLVKKSELRGEPIPKEEIAKEWADTFIYLNLLGRRLGLSMGSAVVEKFNEVSRRRGVAIYLTLDKLCIPAVAPESAPAPAAKPEPPPAPPVETYSGTDEQKRVLAGVVKLHLPNADKARLKAISDQCLGVPMVKELEAKVFALCCPPYTGPAGSVSDDANALATRADQLRGVVAITDWVRTVQAVVEAHAIKGSDLLVLYRRALARCEMGAEFSALEVIIKDLAEDAALVRQLGLTSSELGALQAEHQRLWSAAFQAAKAAHKARQA